MPGTALATCTRVLQDGRRKLGHASRPPHREFVERRAPQDEGLGVGALQGALNIAYAIYSGHAHDKLEQGGQTFGVSLQAAEPFLPNFSKSEPFSAKFIQRFLWGLSP